MSKFKLRSEISEDGKDHFYPDFINKNWSDLGENQKENIWHFLEGYFFSYHKENTAFGSYTNCIYLSKFGIYYERAEELFFMILEKLNQLHKFKPLAPRYHKSKDKEDGKRDVKSIFLYGNVHEVFELLSVYCFIIKEQTNINLNPFFIDINDIFRQYGLNYILTNQGIIPLQDKIIAANIYLPTLEALCDNKRKPVNENISSAFEDYRNGDYSGAITKSYSATQSFLQILLYNEHGKGDFTKMIAELRKSKKIPNDVFTEIIFKNIDSILAQDRKKFGDGHGKHEIANEKNARIFMNCCIIFIQHCLT